MDSVFQFIDFLSFQFEEKEKELQKILSLKMEEKRHFWKRKKEKIVLLQEKEKLLREELEDLKNNFRFIAFFESKLFEIQRQLHILHISEFDPLFLEYQRIYASFQMSQNIKQLNIVYKELCDYLAKYSASLELVSQKKGMK